MSSLFFWNKWVRDYRLIWYLIFAMFLFSLGCMWYHYVNGAAGVISWEKLQEQKAIETTIHTFRLGPFHLTIPAESYVIFEYFSGSDLQHNFFASYSALIVLAFGGIMLLSIITVLERFWYFVGLSLFVMCMVALRFEVLSIFGFRNLFVPGVIIGCYLILSFYFKYFRPHTSFVIRLGSFALLTAVLIGTISLYSEVSYPFMHLVITSYVPTLILALLFIILVAHEIMVGFVYVTNDTSSGSGAKHFALISAFYLVYVIITALHEMGIVQWNFIYINLFLLLTISSILGIWGFRLREPQVGGIIEVAPFGIFMITTLGAIAMITLSQHLGNANDATMKVFRDMIIFSHAGFGIIFFIYFLSNFMAMLVANRPVYEVLYKPNRMPYFTFQFAGIITMLAFVFYSQWREYIYQATGGFYNYVADLHVLQENDAFAISFYEQSRSRAFQNNRANYALATLRTSRLDFENAMENYRQSNAKRPTEFSLVNEGNMSLWTRQYFDAIKSFKSAALKIDNSPYLDNNLGYSLAKVHSIDSATIYLNSARDSEETRASAEANFLAMAAAEYIPINTDSVLTLFGTKAPSVLANGIALASLFRQPLKTEITPTPDKALDLYTATQLNNYIIYHAKDLDTAFTSKAYAIAMDSNNYAFSEALRASLAHAYYHQGNTSKALAILGELAYVSQDYQGSFNYTMGLWALEQGDPMLAASYFRFAEDADYKDVKLYYAIALSEARDTKAAIKAWDSVSAQNDIGSQQLAETMKTILQSRVSEIMQYGDKEKYQFCRYNIGLSDSVTFNQVLNSFENANYKGQALLDRTAALLKADRLIPAIRTFNKIAGLELTDKRLFESIQLLELRMLASRKEIFQLAQQINKGVNFDQSRTADRLLYTSLIAESNRDTVKAEQGYRILAGANPFFEEGVLAAVDYYRSRDPQSMKPYTILVDAIYTNKFSQRLLRAYAEEARRRGFEEYAVSAFERLKELEIYHR